MKKTLVASLALAALVASASAARYVMYVSSDPDRVWLLDPTTGAAVDDRFIDVTLQQTNGTITAIEALQVGNEIWVTDQIGDRVFRYNLAGAPIGNIDAGLDNVRGLGYVGGYVWVTNAGSANGAVANTLVKIDTNGSILGYYPTVNSPFDVVEAPGGDLQISSFGAHNVARMTTSGASLGDFIPAGSIRGPEQMFQTGTGDWLIAGFSFTTPIPTAVYRFSSAGAVISHIADGTGPRGVLELGNGNVLFTKGDGAFSLAADGSGFATQVATGAGRFLNFVDLPGAAISISGTLSLQGYDPLGSSRTYSIDLTLPGSTTTVASRAILTTSDAPFTAKIYVEPGTYDVYVGHENGLRRLAQSNVAFTPLGVTGLTATVVNGDVDHDNDVDIDDYDRLANAYGRALGQTGYYYRADLDGDNDVDIDDYDILANSYGQFGD